MDLKVDKTLDHAFHISKQFHLWEKKDAKKCFKAAISWLVSSSFANKYVRYHLLKAFITCVCHIISITRSRLYLRMDIQ